jgi:Fe-S-cluster containining protein
MIAVVRAFCLGFHARYACRHSGACCTAGWRIPAEPAVMAAVRARGIRSAREPRTALFDPPEPTCVATGEWTIALARDGGCVFLEGQESPLCAIHRAGGPAILPSACRQFPRVTLRDGRGVFVTLSHFCPTAAEMLAEARRIDVVEAPASLTLDGAVEGLDATAVMPPLLRPGMLTDLAGYDAWERAGLAVLGCEGHAVDRAIDVIARATADVTLWRPGAESLADRVAASFRSAAEATAPRRHAPDDPALRAFIASHLFGNWISYQREGLMAVAEYLRDALALVRRELIERGNFIEAVRAVDLRLRHS